MRAHTDAFAEAVKRSHKIAVRAQLLVEGVEFGDPLPVVSGSVLLDRTQSTFARVDSLTLATLPASDDDVLLSPYGNEVAISRGLVHDDGTEELLSLGVFPIQLATIDLTTRSITLRLLDRSQRVRDARFEDEYSVASGTNVGTAIQAIVSAAVPTVSFVFASTSYTTPLLTFAAGADRWEAVRTMASDAAMDLYFDGDGLLRMEPVPSVAATPDWEVSEGDDGVLVSGALSLDRSPAVNKVIVVGENAGNTSTPTGSAIDDNPNSPSYYYGPFGHKPKIHSSPNVTSGAQATAVAEAMLANSLGLARSLNLTTIPNPALEPGDTIRVTRLPSLNAEMFIVDTLAIDLGPGGAMTASGRVGATS